MKTNRASGIELLRICAIFGVIMIHYYESIRGYILDDSTNHVFILLRSLSSASVDVFVIISGYFLINSDNRKIGKALTLLVQVSLFSLCNYLINVSLGTYDLSIRHIISSLISQSYYTTLYIVLYFVSPYLNITLRSLNPRDLRRMSIFLFCMFSVYSSAITLYSEIIGVQWFGLNPIGAWGSQQGFNIVNFVLLYLIGAFIRICKFDEKISNTALFLCLVLCSLFIFVWAELNQYLQHFGQISAWCYDNPIVIIIGVLYFLLFKRFDISNKVINRLASAAYTTFLIHFIVLSNISGKIFYEGIEIEDGVVRFIAFSIIIYIISWSVYEIYNILTHKFYKYCDKINLKYFTN